MPGDDPATTEAPPPAESVVVELEHPRGGRPTKFRREFIRMARVMCRGGATDVELAEAFDVTVATIYNWKAEHPEFFEATKTAKDVFDDRIERAFAQRAAGYVYTAEKIIAVGGKIYRVPILEHVPADVRASYLWLRNRRPDEWRQGMSGSVSSPLPLPPPDEVDAPAVIEHGDLLDMSEEQLEAILREEYPELTEPPARRAKKVKRKG